MPLLAVTAILDVIATQPLGLLFWASQETSQEGRNFCYINDSANYREMANPRGGNGKDFRVPEALLL
jgi:hypothetical protein